ncbi:MAG: carbon-nitrogen hydrolase family protein [Planctomycetota bacterium]|nr:carbon-nitrogen hydrolase family protein [Planctomycetota bacterium]
MYACKCLTPLSLVLWIGTLVGILDAVEDTRSGVRVIRVAALSFVPAKFDLQANADRMETMFRLARRGGAVLAVAPEGALEGYVVNEIIAGQASPEQMKQVAVTCDGPLIRRFRNLARELEMCLAFGFAERQAENVYNAAIFIDDQGQVRGKYHKMQFAEGYHPSWWFNRLGQRSRAFDTPFGRCGFLICNDRWNPRLARIPVLDGAQFLLIPSFGSCSLAQDAAVLSRGRENGVPVVEANVGVTLIVDNKQVAAVDRLQEGITFGNITIRPASASSVAERNQVEQEFLTHRVEEMRRRYRRTMKRVRSEPSE